MKIPIIEKKGNEYTDTLSNKSFALELKPMDLDHLSGDEIESYFNGITQSLLKMTTEDGSFLKLYSMDGKIYANTSNSGLEFPSVAIDDCDNLLKILLGEQITSSNIINMGDHLKTGGQYLRLIRLREYPHEIADEGHFNQLGNYFVTMRPISNFDASIKLDPETQNLAHE